MSTNNILTPRHVAAIALLTFAPGAFAYLDPSTGSMILSAIVGIFATLSLAVKTYWYKLKSYFRGDNAGDMDRGVSDRAADSGDDRQPG
ncbi:MAG: hypothetical protein KJO35_06365 [Gammaproteobacteria bacterium]|nr:hypothetical protein [Gammaproteobacteria bacterium]